MSRLSYIATTLGLFLALGAAAAPDDGSFTIRISGPDDGTAAAAQSAPAQPARQARPAAAAPRAQAAQQARPAARTAQTQAQAPVQAQSVSPEDNALVSVSEDPERTYQVQPQDTLWSISHRMLPLDGSVNEFQAAASIYRRNPDAFAGGNVNALRRVTLNIPGTATMARETTETGAQLLRRGSMQLPPLSETPSVQSQIAAAQSAPDDAGTENLGLPPRRFTAQETSARQISRQSNRDVENMLMPVESENMSNADGQAESVRAAVQAPVPAPTPAPAQTAQREKEDFEPVAASSLDFQVVRDLIENTNQRIAKQNDEVDKKISSSLLRTEKIAQNAAADTAKTEVAGVMSRYESIIADLQQSNAELRANLSRMGKQIDQIRTLSSDNADALAIMQERMAVAGMTDAEGQSIVPQGPMMWILLGIGLMSLVLVATLFFFKRKSRSDGSVSEEEDFMPSNMGSAELISSAVSLTEEQMAELKEKEEEEAAQKAMLEAEAKLAEERKAQEQESADRRLDADEITIPESMFEGDEELAEKARQLTKKAKQPNDSEEAQTSEESKKKVDLEKRSEPDEQPEDKQEEPKENAGPSDEILQAWDEAAKEGAGDKDTLDAWAQALEASEQEQTPPKAVSASSLAKEDEAVVSEDIAEDWGESAKQTEPPKAQDQSMPQNPQAQLNPFANPSLNPQGAAATQNLQPQMLEQMAQLAALLGMMNGQLGQLKPEQLAQVAAILQQNAQGSQAPSAQPETGLQQPQEQAAASDDPAMNRPEGQPPQEQNNRTEDLFSQTKQPDESLSQDEGPALWDTADLADAEPELTADEKLARDWAAAMASKQGQEPADEGVDPNFERDLALQEQDSGPKDEAPAPTSPDAGAPKQESEDTDSKVADKSADDLTSDLLFKEELDHDLFEQELPAAENDPVSIDESFESEEPAKVLDGENAQAELAPEDEADLTEESWQEQEQSAGEAELSTQDTPDDELQKEAQAFADDEREDEAASQDEADESFDPALFDEEASAFEHEFDEEQGDFSLQDPQAPEFIDDLEQHQGELEDEDNYEQELPENLAYEPQAISPDTQLEGGLTAAELAAMADEPREFVEADGAWESSDELLPPDDERYDAQEQGVLDESIISEQEPYEQPQEDMSASYEVDEAAAQEQNGLFEDAPDSDDQGHSDSHGSFNADDWDQSQAQNAAHEEDQQDSEEFAFDSQPSDGYQSSPPLQEGVNASDKSDAYLGQDDLKGALADWEQEGQELSLDDAGAGSADDGEWAGFEEPQQEDIEPQAGLDGAVTAEESAAMTAEPMESAQGKLEDKTEPQGVSSFDETGNEPGAAALESLIEDAPKPQESQELRPEIVESADEAISEHQDLAFDEGGSAQEGADVAAEISAAAQTELAGQLEKGPVTSGGYNADDLAAMMDDGSQERPLIEPYESEETADGFGAEDLAGMMADPEQYDPKNVQDLAFELQKEMTKEDWSDFNPEDLNAAAMGMGEDGVKEVSASDLKDEPALAQHDFAQETGASDLGQEVLKSEDSLTEDIKEVLSEADRLKAQEQDLKEEPAVTWDVPAAQDDGADQDLSSMLSESGRPVASDLNRPRDHAKVSEEGNAGSEGGTALGSNLPDGTDEVLSQVAFAALSESGPIGQSSKSAESAAPSSPLSEEERQRYNDNLNLALLYFETGDIDDAMELINEIKHCDDHNLALKAYEMAARYGL